MVMTATQVKALRERLKLSQPQFSDRFGIELSTVRAWEQGRHPARGYAAVLLHVIANDPDIVAEAVGSMRR